MYKIVYAFEDYLTYAFERVEREVNDLKKEGWTEQGGVSISLHRSDYCDYFTVAQAMVKKE